MLVDESTCYFKIMTQANRCVMTTTMNTVLIYVFGVVVSSSKERAAASGRVTRVSRVTRNFRKEVIAKKFPSKKYSY